MWPDASPSASDGDAHSRKFVGKANDLGTVEIGKLADLVLLDANPLEDIRNTQRISAVVLDGRLFRRGDLDRLLREGKQLASRN